MRVTEGRDEAWRTMDTPTLQQIVRDLRTALNNEGRLSLIDASVVPKIEAELHARKAAA